MRLRITRIILQIVVTVFLFSLFLFSWKGFLLFHEISFLQFIPSFLQFVDSGGLIPLIVWAGILVGTLLFGRFYCGILCPLGAVQDGLFFLSGRKKKLQMSFHKGHPWIQLPVLLAVILFTVFGSSLLVGLLDPFGVFGRTVALVVKPFLYLSGSVGSSFLEEFGVYPMMAHKPPLFVPMVFSISAALFIFPSVLSLFRGRLYCNSVCPVGTVLSWCSEHAVFKLHIDSSRCTRCMKCSRQCRSSCIDISKQRIDGSRCTLCFDCIQACPENAISFSRESSLSDGNVPVNSSRRTFLAHMSLAAGSLTAAAAFTAFPLKKTASLLPFPEEGPVTPPGSRGYRHLSSLCSSCYACVSACPTRVIRPALLEYGGSGLFKPILDYSYGFCEYGCTNCLEVCPTGAIGQVSLTEKKRIQIGLSNLDIEKCVVKLKGEDCGACAEACPTRAVIMVEYEDGLFYPETRNNYCIGCGACEHACPARPLAITVTGKSVHSKASMVHAGTTQAHSKTEPEHEDIGGGEEEFPF